MNVENIKLLVVDDSEESRTLLAVQLEDCGFTDVTFANDGKHAWFCMRTEKYDCVVCDWVMPEMTGIELLEKVRNNDSLKKVPFVLISAAASQDKVKRALLKGVDDFIVKPIDAEKLKDKIRSVTAKKEAV